MSNNSIIRWMLKPLVFLICLLPLGTLAWQGIHGSLGANPIEELTHSTGDWALRMLLITLAITPLRQLTGLNWIIRFRRMLGLYAFFYAILHLACYVWLDQFFNWSEIINDVIKRPYITVGFAAFILLIPLAATSTQWMIRKLKRRWALLHRSVYVIAVLGVTHFFWLVKADYREPIIYATVLTLLLVYRLGRYLQRRLQTSSLEFAAQTSNRGG